jgi:hypothetical protein
LFLTEIRRTPPEANPFVPRWELSNMTVNEVRSSGLELGYIRDLVRMLPRRRWPIYPARRLVPSVPVFSPCFHQAKVALAHLLMSKVTCDQQTACDRKNQPQDCNRDENSESC